MKFLSLLLPLVLEVGLLEAAQIKGVVLSAETGEALERVTVYLAGTGYRTETDAEGRFQLEPPAPATYLLVATAVGFGLVKREIAPSPEGVTEVEVRLNSGTHIAQEVTVTAERTPSQPELEATEIHTLKSVLADDPIRALQQLPGLISNDDFKSGFALQGSGFDRVGMLLDGIPVYAFLHTMQGVKDTGSTTVLSADLFEGIDLVRGGTSAEWGGHSAGFLKLRSRTGNQSNWRSLASISGSAALVLSEGPLPQGNWIVSARKSYMDWMVRKIDSGAELNFGFHDVFAKVTQSRGEKHQFSFSFHHGNTGLDTVAENIGLNAIHKGRFSSDLAHLGWAYLPTSHVSASTHFYWQRAEGLNRNREGRAIWNNHEDIFGARTVWDVQLFKHWLLSAGATAERWQADNQQESYHGRRRTWVILSSFDTATSKQEAFVQARIPVFPAVTFSAGWTWARLAAGAQTFSSPFMSLEVSPGAGHLGTLSWGQSHQFPFLAQMYGEAGNPLLRPEISRVIQGGWSYRRAGGWETKIFGFHRRRREVPWRREGLWRLVDGKIAPPAATPFENILRDRSSGAEIQLARKALNGLSGWIGYAWGQSLWSERDEAWFPGNYDQRHALSLFAHYRWSAQVDLSLKWKYAGGLPLPAYVSGRENRYFLSADRNLERLPDYNRLDGRLAKTFNKDRYRWTLFVEILNLLGRKNKRFSGFGLDYINFRTGEVRDLVQRQFPFLPTAGVLVEF